MVPTSSAIIGYGAPSLSANSHWVLWSSVEMPTTSAPSDWISW